MSPTYWVGVLISCAIPAASCPIASIFCACSTWCSSARRAVMSLTAPTIRVGVPPASPYTWPRPVSQRTEPSPQTTRKLWVYSVRPVTAAVTARSSAGRSSGCTRAMKVS